MPNNDNHNITGYRHLNGNETSDINKTKELEKKIAQHHAYLVQPGNEYDPRCLAIARTKFDEAFHWMVRAIAKPENPGYVTYGPDFKRGG